MANTKDTTYQETEISRKNENIYPEIEPIEAQKPVKLTDSPPAFAPTAPDSEENPFVPKIVPFDAKKHETSKTQRFFTKHKYPLLAFTCVFATTLTVTLSVTLTCNKNFPKNCRDCDELSYWRNLKKKRNEFDISDENWQKVNLTKYYDPKNGECQNYKCSCEFGSPAINICSKNLQSYCQICDDGYYLEDNICKKNVCVCENGTPSCNKGVNHGESSCLKCDPSYVLSKPDEFNTTHCNCPTGMTERWFKSECKYSGYLRTKLSIIKPGREKIWTEYLVDQKGRALDNDEQFTLYYVIKYGRYSDKSNKVKTKQEMGIIENYNDIKSRDFYDNMRSKHAYFVVELYEHDILGSNDLAFKFEYDAYELVERLKNDGRIVLKEKVGKGKLLDFVVTVDAV